MREFGVNTIAYMWALNEGIDQTELLSHIRDNGGSIAEVRREYIKKEQLERIAERAKLLDQTVYYSVPEELFVNGQVNYDMLKEVMEEAQILTAACVKFSLGDLRKVDDAQIKELCEYVNGIGPFVLIENGPKGPEGDADLLEEFFRRQEVFGGNVKLTFDTGNFAAAGFDPLECAKRLAKKTAWIHLKDMKQQDGSTVNTMLGEGEIPFEEILSLFGREVPAAIEYPCADYGQVAEEMEKAQKLLGKFN